jgi:hypothetical protein
VQGQLRNLRREPFRVPSLSSFGEGATGELFAVGLGGELYKLTG